MTDARETGVPDEELPTTRIRFDIAYDGSNFTGWTRQPGLRTVQGVLEDALAIIFGRHLPAPVLTVAGRTDAGVHATGQVAHIDLTPAQFASLERPHRGPAKAKRIDPIAALGRRLNGIAGLDSDVYVSRVSLAPEGFDARFGGVWRRYEYRIADAAGPRNPLERNRTVWYPAVLDMDRMNEAAETLLGLHDWAAFCKPPPDLGTTIRTLEELRWRRDRDGVLIAGVRADAFCHSMVRALVGACVAVGEGKLDVRKLAPIRDGLERTSDFKVMPAKGLILVEVGYPADGMHAARVLQTKATRPPLPPRAAAGLTAVTPED